MSNYLSSIQIMKAWPARYSLVSELLWLVLDLAAAALA